LLNIKLKNRATFYNSIWYKIRTTLLVGQGSQRSKYRLQYTLIGV